MIKYIKNKYCAINKTTDFADVIKQLCFHA